MFRKFGRKPTDTRKRGIATVWGILWIPVFIVALSGVIELGTQLRGRAQFERILGGAALAALDDWNKDTADATAARTNAKDFAEANKVNGQTVQLEDSDILLGTVPADENSPFMEGNTPNCPTEDAAVRIQASMTLNSSIFGSVTIASQATAVERCSNGTFTIIPDE